MVAGSNAQPDCVSVVRGHMEAEEQGVRALSLDPDTLGFVSPNNLLEESQEKGREMPRR